MKTFSAFNLTKADNPNVSPVKLAKWEFDGLILYLCDRNFGDAGSEFVFDSQIYEPLVLSWDDIQYGEVGQLGEAGTPSDFSFRVDNTVPVAGFDSLTAIFSTYQPIYSKITLYEFYEGATVASDLITREVGTVEDIDMELEYINVNCTSLEISIANQFTIEVCTEETYSGADPDDWGKMLPVVYGSTKRVPFISVDAGTMDVLAEDINSSVTEFDGSDLTKFPQGGGTIQIDFEEMTYAYIDGSTFKSVTRAANGTTAIAHDTGATIAEIQTEYFFILGHAVKSLDAVYVVNRNNDENVLQPSSMYTLYTGQSGNEHASYPGKACIVFNTLPTIAPQVNLEVEEDIDTVDTIDVNDTIDVGTGNHGHGGDSYYVWHMINAVDISGPGGYIDEGAYDDNSSRYHISDGSFGSYVNMSGAGAEIQIQNPYAEEGPGTPTYYTLNMTISFQNSQMRAKFTWDGKSITSGWGASGQGTLQSGSYSTTKTWAQLNALLGTVVLEEYGGAYGTVTVRDVWIEIRHSEVESGPATGVAKSGAASKSGAATKTGTAWLVGNSVADTVIGGAVSADVQGYQADASGDYGTEAALIQRPDYVFKHFLVTYCGLVIADNIDTNSYGTSGTLYSNDNVNLGVVLLERPDMREFLSLMAQQCKTYQFWERGKHFLKRVPVTETTNKLIEGGRIDINSVKVRYTPRDEIINRYTVNFDKHWVGDFASTIESYRGIVTVESSPSQAIYGVLEGEPLNLDYVYNSTQALRLGNWLLDDTSYPRLIVEFSGGQYLAELERGDIIGFEFEAGDELDRRFLGLIISGSDQFRIMGMRQNERGIISILAYAVVSSTSNSGTFYPAVISDDGYTQGANFYNTTVANVIGSYSGLPHTSTTTTTTTTTPP